MDKPYTSLDIGDPLDWNMDSVSVLRGTDSATIKPNRMYGALNEVDGATGFQPSAPHMSTPVCRPQLLDNADVNNGVFLDKIRKNPLLKPRYSVFGMDLQTSEKDDKVHLGHEGTDTRHKNKPSETVSNNLRYEAPKEDAMRKDARAGDFLDDEMEDCKVIGESCRYALSVIRNFNLRKDTRCSTILDL